MRVALDHGHAQGGVLPPQLDRQRQPGEAAAEDGDVGIGACFGLRAHPVRSTPGLACIAANSPSGSSITGGCARQRRYSAITPPCPKTCRTTCEVRSEEHNSDIQSLMRISYAALCLKKKTTIK